MGVFECDVNDLCKIPNISASSPQANGDTQGKQKRGNRERVRASLCVAPGRHTYGVRCGPKRATNDQVARGGSQVRNGGGVVVLLCV